MKIEPHRFFHGDLLVEVRGDQPERLLNLALQAGLDLERISRRPDGSLLLRLTPEEFRRLRPLTRAGRCTLRICRRRGLPFVLAFIRRRPLLPLYGLLFGFLLAFCCSLVAGVSVTSPEELSGEEARRVLELADQAGVRAGRSRWLMDPEAAEQAILQGFPQLFYAEILTRGNRLEIKVVRRVDVPPEEQIRPAGDLVAAAPGLIRDVLVQRGTAQVAPGDTVKAGQVLISGAFAADYLGAVGIVTALVYGQGYGEARLLEVDLQATGRVCQQLGLSFSGGNPALLAGSDPGFLLGQVSRRSRQLFLWRKIPLPVELVLVELAEVDPVRVSREQEEAAALARQLAQDRAELALCQWDQAAFLEEPQFFCQELDLNDGLRRACCTASCLADIGLFQALEPGPAQ